MHGQCQRIGEAAGKIYQALENGSKTLETLAKETHLNDTALFNQAIGWLCREDKLHFEKKGTILEVALAVTTAGSCCK